MRILLKLLALLAVCLAADPSAYAAKDKEEGGEEEEELSEEEKAEEVEKEKKRLARAARVVVLKWSQAEMKRGISADYQDELLIRNVKSRIDRPDALFFPSMDLYQRGRRSPDKTVPAAEQPALVPDYSLEEVLKEVDRVSQIPFGNLDANGWTKEARALLKLVDTVWFVEKVEQREPLFLLYTQIGRAADYRGNNEPPFYELVGGTSVTYYYYRAAALALEEASLMSKITDQELYRSIDYYLKQLREGKFPAFPLDFELDGDFDPEAFAESYTVLINGLEVEIDANARYDLLLGRNDIYLRRNDTGHGLSDKLEVDKLDEETSYSVLTNARKEMGLEFIDQLMLHPNECSPELTGKILNFLSIYAKLHTSAEIYIAVPENGSANKVHIWRWDRSTATLQKVGGGANEFPVHFMVTANGGFLYNYAELEYQELSDEEMTNASSEGVDFSNSVGPNFDGKQIPLNLDFRVHWSRLMVAYGFEWSYSLAEGGFQERYRTPIGGADDSRSEDVPYRVQDCVIDADGEIACAEQLRKTNWNRYHYGAVGVVLGRNAGWGLGPRFAARIGGTNLPTALQTTAHFGWTFRNPIFRKATGRIRPVVDIDGRGGVVVPVGDSVLKQACSSSAEGVACVTESKVVVPIFGLTLGLGTTL